MSTSTKKLIFLLLIPVSTAEKCTEGANSKQDLNSVIASKKAAQQNKKDLLKANKAKVVPKKEKQPSVIATDTPDPAATGYMDCCNQQEAIDERDNAKADIYDEDKGKNKNETAKTSQKKGILNSLLNKLKVKKSKSKKQ